MIEYVLGRALEREVHGREQHDAEDDLDDGSGEVATRAEPRRRWRPVARHCLRKLSPWTPQSRSLPARSREKLMTRLEARER